MSEATPTPVPETQVLSLVPPAPALTTDAKAAANRLTVRVWCIFTFSICFSILGIGRILTPDPDGFGKTRGLFGMPPCGFYACTGYPCPTCGCTTAVSHFAHGEIITSFFTQPFGFTVALLCLVAGSLSLVGAVTGKWIGPSMFFIQWHWRLWLYSGIALLLISWGYKAIMVKMAG